jgi:hypothetical protein
MVRFRVERHQEDKLGKYIMRIVTVEILPETLLATAVSQRTRLRVHAGPVQQLV